MSSFHSKAPVDAGLLQYLGSCPHTLPDFLPDGPGISSFHLNHVDNVGWKQSHLKFIPTVIRR